MAVGDVVTGMRSLMADPIWPPASLYRRFWRRCQLDAMIPDLMVRGEPYLALNGLVLPAADQAMLERLTSLFSRVFDRAGRHVAPDVPLTVSLGFPWAAAELLAVETPRVPIVARFDFVQDRAGRWHLLEMNADTPSGVREAIVCDRLVQQLVPGAGVLARPSAVLAPMLVREVADALSRVPAGGTLGLVTTASELEDLAQMAFTAELLRPRLADARIGVILGDISNLARTRSGLTLLGRRVDAIYRYVPFEGMFGTSAFVALEEAAALGTVHLLNGLFGLLLQNKGLMAWIWERRADAAVFDAEERAAIAEHLPATWRLDEVPGDLDRRELVAKQVFGREGAEVFFGEDVSADVWAALAGRRTYIGQRRVDVGGVRAAVQSSVGPVVWDGRPTVGCFAVGGTFAGYYTRFGDKITTSRAKWVATFAEPGDRG